MKRFRAAERPGAYARVLSPGEVATGDEVELLPAPDGPTLLESYRVYYDKRAPTEAIRRLLDLERRKAARRPPFAVVGRSRRAT